MSRRNFLRKLGVGLATIPLAKITTANTQPTKNYKPLLKLGVLVPDSTRYPVLADNFLDGLRLQLETNKDLHNHEIELLIEKYQTTKNDIVRKATKLAEMGRVDVMTGLVSCFDTIKIKELLESRHILFVENTLGEVIQASDVESECIFRNSFHLWNSSFIAGEWAAKNLGKKAILASSFYDSGFNSFSAFIESFEGAGGLVLHKQITDIPGQNGHLELQREIKSQKPDFVFGHYSGIEAISFVQTYKNSGLEIPLIGSGLMCNDSNLNAQSSSAVGIRSFSTWARTIDNSVNQEFVKSFEGIHQRYADHYAVLGYETGQLFRKALSQTGKYPTTQDLIFAFSSITIDSPRGQLKIKNQHTLCPVYLKKVTSKEHYYLEYISDQFELIDKNSCIVNEMRQKIQSGWSNAYMT